MSSKEKQTVTREDVGDVGKIIDAKPESAQLEKQDLSHGEIVNRNIPDYIKRGQRGTEVMEQTDIILPRLAIAQANSPQRKKLDPLYVPGLEEGVLFNTLTGEQYGTKVTVLPLFLFKNRFYFGPYGSGEGIICQSANAVNGGRLHPTDCVTCPHAAFKNDEEDQRPDCTMIYNYVSLLPKGSTTPWASISLKSTDTKEAKQYNAKIRMSGLDMFARTLEVSTIGKTQKGNSFYGFVLKPLDFIPKALYEHAEAKFNELRAINVKVDTRGMDQEDTEFHPGQM